MKPDLKGLTKLAQHIKRVPRKQFDMEQWLTESPCGTTACIAGWAATIFPSRFRRVYNYTEEGEAPIKQYIIENRRTGSEGSEAFADGFHISLDDAEDLTMDWYFAYSTPAKAAKAIMALVHKLEKEG